MEEGRVHPDCINSSNPYHECVDFCFRRILEMKEQREQVPVPKRQGSVHPNCLNSSNPNHVCGFFCFRRLREKGISNFWKTTQSLDNQSNPSHECKDVGEDKVRARKPKLQEKIRRRSIPDTKSGVKRLLLKYGAKQERIFGGNQERIFFPDCINSSNPYHECSFFCYSMRAQKCRVLPACINSSNPYHECSEFCLRKINVQANFKNLEEEMRSKQVKQGGKVHPDCINSSNPYHECTEFCLQRIAEATERREQDDENRERKEQDEKEKREREEEVSKNGDECTDFCLQRIDEAKEGREQYEEEEEEKREQHEEASMSGSILDTKEHGPIDTKDLDDEIGSEWEQIDMEILL